MKPENFFFRTRSLQFSPLSLKDKDNLHRLLTSEAACASLWGNDITDIEQSKSIISNSKKLFKKENLGLWTVKHKKTESFLGFGGFWYLHEPPERKLVFAVEKKYWGQGYATEIARAILHFGFECCNVPVVAGSNSTTNTASSRVLQKAGLLFKQQVRQDDVDTVYYEISKTRWIPDDSLEFDTSE